MGYCENKFIGEIFSINMDKDAFAKFAHMLGNNRYPVS